MKDKLRDAIKNWNYDELRKFEKEIGMGGREVKKIIWEKMQELDNSTKFCTTCFAELEPRETAYTLIFGPEDFKKKASFCAVDCLQYFLSHIRELEKVKRKTRSKNDANR